jgi:hypothetical protein
MDEPGKIGIREPAVPAGRPERVDVPGIRPPPQGRDINPEELTRRTYREPPVP